MKEKYPDGKVPVVLYENVQYTTDEEWAKYWDTLRMQRKKAQEIRYENTVMENEIKEGMTKRVFLTAGVVWLILCPLLLFCCYDDDILWTLLFVYIVCAIIVHIVFSVVHMKEILIRKKRRPYRFPVAENCEGLVPNEYDNWNGYTCVPQEQFDNMKHLIESAQLKAKQEEEKAKQEEDVLIRKAKQAQKTIENDEDDVIE